MGTQRLISNILSSIKKEDIKELTHQMISVVESLNHMLIFPTHDLSSIFKSIISGATKVPKNDYIIALGLQGFYYDGVPSYLTNNVEEFIKTSYNHEEFIKHLDALGNRHQEIKYLLRGFKHLVKNQQKLHKNFDERLIKSEQASEVV